MILETKRGDEFAFDFQAFDDESGLPVDLTGMTITSAVRLRGFLDTLTVTVIDAPNGEYRLSAPASQTALWPVAKLASDVKFDAGAGHVRRTITFHIEVDEEVTP